MTWEDDEKKENDKIDKLLKEDGIVLDKKQDNLPKVIIPINAAGQKAFELMEAEDEKQIVNLELLRETVKTFVYKPKQGELTLTITGIFEVARRYKNIDIGIKEWQKTEDSWMVTAYAKNLRDNIYNEAIVEQPFRAPIGPQGSLVKDAFAFQKAQSKAKRNAIRQVIPANYFQSMIKLFLKDTGVQK
jgi:hypothetical protein